MPTNVEFHFILLAVGQVLKYDNKVTALKVQDCILDDDAFGVRVPLSDCRLALTLMENAGFISMIASEFALPEKEYERVLASK